ncbi:MAG: cytochrome c biogenesis protein CcsA [Caldilineaceae bacterium]|nr:cytochrome c biogenesis protein CcsA [Caldilineaceae bacterium]HRJ43247.1 cytochrome c biogenesis protein CcsA [Caldilineaceae bacterium]
MATTASIQRKGDPWYAPLLALDVLAGLAMVVAIWAGLLFAKDATNLAGDEQIAQRIFYFHMGCNITATLGFLLSVIGSLGYLVRRSLVWDRIAQAGVEVGTLFGFGIMTTGALWAKPTWNTYWTWDPRLTTATITILIYLAYMLFRNGMDNRHTRARFSAIYALFAFLSVPFTYYSARIFRSIHPIVFDGANAEAQGSFNIGPSMGQTLLITITCFTILFLALFFHRWRQLSLESRIEDLREELYQ